MQQDELIASAGRRSRGSRFCPATLKPSSHRGGFENPVRFFHAALMRGRLPRTIRVPRALRGDDSQVTPTFFLPAAGSPASPSG